MCYVSESFGLEICSDKAERGKSKDNEGKRVIPGLKLWSKCRICQVFFSIYLIIYDVATTIFFTNVVSAKSVLHFYYVVYDIFPFNYQNMRAPRLATVCCSILAFIDFWIY